jgi:hypothetical protein
MEAIKIEPDVKKENCLASMQEREDAGWKSLQKAYFKKNFQKGIKLTFILSIIFTLS